MFYPFKPKIQDQEYQEKPRRREPESNLIKDFFTKPFSLPIWLWNTFVVSLYLTMTVLILQVAAIVVIGILQFLS